MAFRTSDEAAPVISVEQVWCCYGDFTAVQDVSFEIRAGAVHALLGTNGAGKTTLLETIQGFRRPAGGRIAVLGADPAKDRSRIAARTGTMLQESGLVDEMTVAGQLALWEGMSMRRDSVARVLELVGLFHRRRVPVSVLSGGERRRLDFAMALWGNPELVVLDEPTTGLDPQSRRTMWAIIEDLVGHGSTVLLTTHYLQEAQGLADTVTILDRGKVARAGSMGEVLASIPATIEFIVAAEPDAITDLAGILTGRLERTPAGNRSRIGIRTQDLQSDVGSVIDWARRHELLIEGLRSSPASLEDVFLELADQQRVRS